MSLKSLCFFVLIPALGMAQGLPDRDELVKKLLQKDQASDAAQQLLIHFQSGGVRTLIRNLSKLPADQRLQFAQAFRYMDLFRFRNDLNASMDAAKDHEEKALFLMLLSTFGRQLDPAIFEPFVDDETLPAFLRLAAMGGIIKAQNPKIYDRFYKVAEKVIVDIAAGQDDLRFADISKKNLGFYLYTRGKVETGEADHGAMMAAIYMAEPGDTDLYKAILDKRKKKYYTLMIDRAIRVGGTELLEVMATHRAAKKLRPQIAKAKPAAEAIGKLRGQLFGQGNPKDYKLGIGPILATAGQGSGTAEGYRTGYAIAKVDKEGQISAVVYEAPFGGSDNLKQLLSGKTMPAYNNWEAVESYVLVMAP